MKHSWHMLLMTKLIICLSFLAMCAPTFASFTLTEGIRIYQKNLHLSPEHKQILAEDITRYQNADNLWDALPKEFTLPHYEESPRVQNQIQWFMNNQDFLYRSASRAAPYLYYILQQARKRHLPAEVVLLPIFESSFNPFASSPVGAAGIWQMMPMTASGYGIKQNWWYDGRRDVVASTKAALNYLAYLGEFFDGNWLYAIAAYDTGEGNILTAIKKNISFGYPTDYWSLPISQETQDYIPKLMALAIIISHPDRYPVELPYVRNAPYLAQVDVGAQIDLKHAAILAGLNYKTLQHLNPGYSRGTTDPNGPFKLVLPIENVEQFSENLEESPISQRIKWAQYKVQTGDTFASIAKHYRTSRSELRKINPMVALNLKPGSTLVVPNNVPTLSKTILASETSSNFSKKTAVIGHKLKKWVSKDTLVIGKNYVMQPGDTFYMVRVGDNIEKIAKHFHVTSDIIRLANHLKPHKILAANDQLIIPTHKPNNNIKKHSLSPGDTLYMVRKGDTIEKIAKKYHTHPATLRVANLLGNKEIREGDALVIPVKI